MGPFTRNNKQKSTLDVSTVLERKGKIDKSSLLDENGDPTCGTLYADNTTNLNKNDKDRSEINQKNEHSSQFDHENNKNSNNVPLQKKKSLPVRAASALYNKLPTIRRKKTTTEGYEYNK